MKFNQILTGLAFLSSFAFASNYCEKFNKELEELEEAGKKLEEEKTYNIIVDQCIEDEEGIKTLVIKNKPRTYGRLPESILHDTALNVEKLTIEGIELNNENVKDIGYLKSLQELNILNCFDYDKESYDASIRGCIYEGDGCLETLRHDINWEQLKGLVRLNKLTINNGIDVPTWVIREYMKNMENIQNLNINGDPQKIYDCKDITNYLKRKGIINESGVECEEDNEGHVTSLNIDELDSQYTDEKDMFKRLTSYPTIKTLTLNMNNLDEENISNIYAPNIIIHSSYPYKILSYEVLDRFFDVRNLTIKNFEINQKALEGIRELTKLKELNIVDCIDYNLNAYERGQRGCMYGEVGCLEIHKHILKWDVLKNLSGLTTLTISNNMDVPTWVIRDIKKNLKKLKKLEINKRTPSELSDCEDIKNYLKRQEVEDEAECVEDEQGQVISLKIAELHSFYTNNQEMIDKLNSYPTLKSLVISNDSLVTESKVPDASTNCEELKKYVNLDDYQCVDNEEGHVSKLTITNAEITNDIINTIRRLTNLEELKFVNCADYDRYSDNNRGCILEGNGCVEVFRHNLNWDNLKDLTKLTAFTIDTDMGIPTWVVREYMKNMKNLINLSINGDPSKLSDCMDIEKYLERKEVDEEVEMECNEDKKGRVTSLIIDKLSGGHASVEEISDRLSSYPTMNSLIINGVSYENDLKAEPIENDLIAEPVTEFTCSKAKDLGYPCCSHCHSIYSDKDGLWGAENGKWCVIPNQCQSEYETCWSIQKGYPCCDHCNVALEDKSGKWGVMNKHWCGIPTSC